MNGKYEFEEWACPLCSVHQSQIAMEFPAHVSKVVKCCNCGMLRLQPRVAEPDLHKVYGETYCGQPGAICTAPGSAVDYIRRWKILRFCKQVHHWRLRTLERNAPARQVLEIGCGDGGLLAFLKEHGWETTGIEMSQHAASLARTKGLHVLSGELEDFHFPDNSFSAITMFHVLEHIYSPKSLLAEIRRILARSGALIIQVPNAGSICSHLFRRHWMGWQIPEHITFYTPKTLTSQLSQSGFRIRQLTHWSPDGLAAWKIGVKGTLRQLLFGDKKPPVQQSIEVSARYHGIIYPPARTVMVDLVLDPIFAVVALLDPLLRSGSTITVVAEKA